MSEGSVSTSSIEASAFGVFGRFSDRKVGWGIKSLDRIALESVRMSRVF